MSLQNFDPAAPSDAAPPAPVRRGRGALAAALVVLLVGAGGALYFATRSRNLPVAPVDLTAPQAAPSSAAAAAGEPSAVGDSAAALPGLDASDDFFRTWARRVIGDAGVDHWLSSSGLLRRLVAAVSSASEGESPAMLLPFLAPEGPFEVEEQGEQTFVAPSTWARYDGAVGVFAKLDARQAGVALKAMDPLLSQAWREIGRPGTTFRSALNRAIDKLLAVPVTGADVEVVSKGAVWAFADSQLESLSPVQKHLLRMGPDNVRRVQGKLRELRTELSR